MAKTKKKEISIRDLYDQNIEDIDIADSTEESMKIYGSNVNILRQVPNIIDGLKSVERRSLYTMYDIIKCNYNKPFNKLANIVGRTMSEFHPHSDAAIKDSVVKMAQSWTRPYPMVEGSGNFGSPAGTVSGAARYIEARLSYYAYKCFFEDFDIGAIETTDNYLMNRKEPVWLPAKYPNILINSVFGIGYGLATGIPSYPFQDVCELAIKILKGEEIDPMTDYLVPDMASGADVIDDGQFPDICSMGLGTFKNRATINVDEDNHALVITSIPIRTNLKKILVAISKEVENNNFPGLRDIYDYKSENEIKTILYFKKEVDLDNAMRALYRMSQLESTVSTKFSLVEDYVPAEYNLYTVLEAWIEARKEIKARMINRRLVKVYERIHILEILLFIFNKDNAEKTLALIKKANTKDDVINGLVKAYKIDSLKARTIADMRLSGFSKSARKGYEEEYKERIKERDSLIKSLKEKNIKKAIIVELEEGIKLFGRPRRSKVVKDSGEHIVKDSNHLIVLTRGGYIKKLPADIKEIGVLAEGDTPFNIIKLNNRSTQLVFDSMGKVNKINIFDVPNSVLSKPGSKLSDFITVNGKMVYVIPRPEKQDLAKLKDPIYFLFVTRGGIIKKMDASTFTNIQKPSTAIMLNRGDEVADANVMVGNKEVILYTKKGYGLRIPTDDITPIGRTAKGIKAMSLLEGDEIIGVDIINKDDTSIMIVTNKGMAKRVALDSIPIMDRYKEPIILIKLEENDLIFKALPCKGNETFNVVQPSGITNILSSDIQESTRLSKGKKRIPVKRNDDILDFYVK